MVSDSTNSSADGTPSVVQDDIVFSLKDAFWNEPHTNVRLCGEAADEIERLRSDSDKWRKIADKLAVTGGCWTCEEWMEIDEFSHGDPEKPLLCEWRVALHQYQKEAIHD